MIRPSGDIRGRHGVELLKHCAEPAVAAGCGAGQVEHDVDAVLVGHHIHALTEPGVALHETE